MKPSAPPQKVIDNPTEYNLTDEYLIDFMDKYREHMMKASSQNKTFTNMTNGTLDDVDHHAHQAINCIEYCDSQMRHFFDEYKQYHGYVTLIVSIEE